jgi:hypothetical protein
MSRTRSIHASSLTKLRVSGGSSFECYVIPDGGAKALDITNPFGIATPRTGRRGEKQKAGEASGAANPVAAKGGSVVVGARRHGGEPGVAPTYCGGRPGSVMKTSRGRSHKRVRSRLKYREVHANRLAA